jgi:hypothetical protein
MKQRKLVWLIVLSIALGACASRRTAQQPKPASYVPSQATVEQGEQVVQTAAVVWKNYKCSTSQLPLMVIENNYLKPATVAVGQRQINHYITYALCPEQGNSSMPATLKSEIYFNNRRVVTNQKPVQIKPGGWLMSGVIDLPPNPKVGTYQLRTEIVEQKSGRRHRAVNANFEVYR